VQAFPASIWSKPIDLAAPSRDAGLNLKGRYWEQCQSRTNTQIPRRPIKSIAVELG
jgi:hypothetical protein